MIGEWLQFINEEMFGEKMYGINKTLDENGL